jgi:hypothetical protein
MKSRDIDVDVEEGIMSFQVSALFSTDASLDIQ